MVLRKRGLLQINLSHIPTHFFSHIVLLSCVFPLPRSLSLPGEACLCLTRVGLGKKLVQNIKLSNSAHQVADPVHLSEEHTMQA